MKNPQVAHFKKQIKKGIALGAVVPVVFSPLICFLIFNHRRPQYPDGGAFHFWDFYTTLLTHEMQFPTFLSLCALSNLPVFFWLLKKKKDWIARGMIYSTMVYAIIYFAMKML
ncbi:MAG: hypothetical protein ACJAZ2_001033 [Glaciecola sp.]|jgi:hypothetical protein